jgi:hypothetical protein
MAHSYQVSTPDRDADSVISSPVIDTQTLFEMITKDSKPNPEIEFPQGKINDFEPTCGFGKYLITRISPRYEKSFLMIPILISGTGRR